MSNTLVFYAWLMETRATHVAEARRRRGRSIGWDDVQDAVCWRRCEIEPPRRRRDGSVAKAAGFSLHAGVASEAQEREKLERLCRYITRPAVSTERLSLTNQGNIRYRLKTPYRDGTTDVVFDPLDFMARLAALVPTPRVNLTRYHGVNALYI